MNAYADFDFLIRLLLGQTRPRSLFQQLIGTIQGPLELNPLHELQSENCFLRLIGEGDTRGETVFQSWITMRAESLLLVGPVGFAESVDLAIQWNKNNPGTPPGPLILLHAALAKKMKAELFVSIMQNSRDVAALAGLKLFPARL